MFSNLKSLRWLGYTVGIAFLPIILRLLICFFTQDSTISISAYAIGDIILFSLIIQLSILTEIDNVSDSESSLWRERNKIVGILWLIALSFLLCLSLISEGGKDLVNGTNLLICSIAIAVVNFILGFRFFNYLNKTSKMVGG
jgi:hypothetical protein